MKKIFIIVFILIFSISFSYYRSKNFFGIDLSYINYDFTMDDFFNNHSLDLSILYGPSLIKPIRGKIGVGSKDNYNFYGLIGLEIPIIEILNDSHAKNFGIYLHGDIHLNFKEIFYLARLGLLFPVNPVAGIRIDVGIDKNRDFLLGITYSGGLYPYIIEKE